MNSTQSTHADHVVSAFKSILNDDTIAYISDTHFGELSLLIEAAIDAALVDRLGQATAIAEDAAKQINKLCSPDYS